MIDRRLIGRCGIYCGTCEIYRAYKDSDGHRVVVAARHRCRPGDVVCNGCQAVHARGWAGDPNWGRNCRIRECLGQRGLRFCSECAAIKRCPTWNQLAESYAMLGVDLRENLEMVRNGTAMKWLAEQDKKWRCIHCGNPYVNSPDLVGCLNCGSNPVY